MNKFKKPPVDSYIFLSHNNNSCYMDSVLVSLFSNIPSFIHKSLFKDDSKFPGIQKELYKIYSGTSSNCIELKKEIGRANNSVQEFHENGMQDAGEFLIYLLDLFDIKGVKIHEITQIGSKPTKRIIESSPVILVENDFLKGKSNVSTLDFLEIEHKTKLDKDNAIVRKGKKYFEFNKRVIIKTAKVLIFYVGRLSLDDKRNFTKVKPEEELSFLKLKAVVVHHSHHYTSYISIGDLWYYYDDSKISLTKVGNYNDLLKASPSVQQLGVLYFYF